MHCYLYLEILKNVLFEIVFSEVQRNKGAPAWAGCPVEQMKNPPLSRYKKTKIPSAGGIYNEIDMDANQTTLI